VEKGVSLWCILIYLSSNMQNNLHFSPNLFWDIDETALNSELHSRYIVERVLMRGRLSDWLALLRLYGTERVKKEALHIRYLDRVTLNFCSQYFNVPKSKFRCYKQPQSIQEHWQF
jgi:hypothetical protein